jgi:hypothetical protein
MLDGLRSITVGDASILFLDRVTDEVSQALKSRLADYCYGRVRAGEAPDYYSFDLTIREFFRLYDTKPDAIRLGLAGELIVHLLAPHGHDRLVSACVYLNKEEHSVKKGFDLTFRDEIDSGIWYGEVKSGRVNELQTADSKVHDLIGNAERDLDAMFTSDVEKKRWDAAISDADLALQTSEASTVKKLLRADFLTIDGGSPAKVRALLCAVVMHPFDQSEISEATGKALLASVSGRGRFKGLRLLLLQQSDVEVLVEDLRSSPKAPV